jgi:hypothetical protein
VRAGSVDEMTTLLRPTASAVVDAAVGLGWWATKVAAGAVSAGSRVARPAVSLALDPPLVPAPLAPRRLLRRVSVTVHEERVEAIESFTALSGPVTVGTVLDRVDLTGLADELLSRVDVNALLLRHVDVGALAQAVVDSVDLPQIVRQASGSLTSETVETIRVQGIDADRAVERLVDRLLVRRRPEVP